jgi:uncharacterized repeat protein (TIGR01451 family)
LLALLPGRGAAVAASLPGADPVIAAAGDISCAQEPEGSSTCRDQATSDLLVDEGLARVLTLGDQQYETGDFSAFNSYYDPTWGRLKAITSPTTGNHDPFSSGYLPYFGSRAPGPYYSYDIGSWHLISLDANNVDVAQTSWLHSDLVANAGNKCVLAYWHHPRFSSGSVHGNNTNVAPFWTELYGANADVVLNGHEHNYERFAPQDPNGVADPLRGIREFVVGTGGKSHYPFGALQPNSEVRSTGTYGVLELALRPGAYEWLFIPEAGKTFSDSGTGICHATADLSVTKSDSPDPALVGNDLTYTLTATNGGPAGASGVLVTDGLPNDVTFESASASQGSCAESSGVVTCDFGTLASATSATATIVVRPLVVGTITNGASVQANELDPDETNNRVTEPTTVNPAADLLLTMSDSPDPVSVGQPLAYTLIVVNSGPSRASGISLSDELPKTARLRSARTDHGHCMTRRPRNVQCVLGELDSGDSADVTIVVRPTRAGTLTNTASVRADQADPTAQNNQASEQTSVPAFAP